MRYTVVYQGAYPPERFSAGNRRVRAIAKGLAATGSDVTLICPAYFGDRPSLADDFEVAKVGRIQDSPSITARLPFWNATEQKIKELQPDFSLFYNTSLDSLPLMRRMRQAGALVGFEQCDFQSTNHPSWWKKRAFQLSERLLPKHSDLVVVITEHIARQIKKVSPQKSTVLVPGLFDISTFSPDEAAAGRFREKHGVGADEIVVTYAGSWWKTKGLSELISAAELAMTRTTIPLRLVIAGRYTGCKLNEVDVAKAIENSSIRDRTILPGFLDADEMVGLLSGSDIVVSPSTDHPFNHAAFPTKVAEYAGMGRAILATRIGDIPLYFKDGHNSVLCDPNSESMAQGIIRLATEANLRTRIATAAAVTAREHFDCKNGGQKIHEYVSAFLTQRKCA